MQKKHFTISTLHTNWCSAALQISTHFLTNTATTTVKATAGIKGMDANGFVLYPNPASGKVTLQLQNTAAAITDVTVTDVLGKTVLTESLQGTQPALDITSLKSGMYFVTIKADGKQLTKKLVVK